MSVSIKQIEDISKEYNIESKYVALILKKLHFKENENELIFIPNIERDLKDIFESLMKGDIISVYPEVYIGDVDEIVFDYEHIMDTLIEISKEIIPKNFIFEYRDKYDNERYPTEPGYVYLSFKEYIKLYGNSFDEDFVKYVEDKKSKLKSDQILEIFHELATGKYKYEEDIIKLQNKYLN